MHCIIGGLFGGQLLIALAPGPLSGGAFQARIEDLVGAVLEQDGTRLPGDRRLKLRQQAQSEGLWLSDRQYDQLMDLCTAGLSK